MKLDRWVGRGLRAVTVFGLVGACAVPALAAEGINPHADEILRAMSRFLAGTSAFSVSADIGNEIITEQGQKLQFNSTATAVVQRPSRLHITRHGRLADAEVFYDGKQLTLYGKTANAYMQKDLTGTLDSALSALETGLGISLPGGDLLVADPYTVLASGVVSSGYYGIDFVGGMAAHHLAFRTAMVDWQLWVKEGNEPLPLKYVITTKWTTGAPQYSVQFSNWNTRPAIAATRFSFAAPKDAVRLDALAVDEMGELAAPQGSK
ncbi:MAG: DUF2092 domain-containing protein [Rubrivivax sp.]|nr:DUF2092 domain-containing protein [Rubrivivax sp.]